MSDNQTSSQARKEVNDAMSNNPSGFNVIMDRTGRSSKSRREDAKKEREQKEAEKSKDGGTKVRRALPISCPNADMTPERHYLRQGAPSLARSGAVG